MKAYKLVRLMKDGSISSLFIDRKKRLSIGEWLQSKCIPTNGFAVREGWHCTKSPIAPHLSKKDRVWIRVEIEDYTELHRPLSQGGIWYLACKMKILDVLHSHINVV